MNFIIEKSWATALKNESNELYFKELNDFVNFEYQNSECFPAYENIFRCFELCSLDKVKVVIIGQDPYHGRNQADGLCFSVPLGIKIPPSLKNIFKEIENDLGIKTINSGNLDRWAQQGILLLNATLTVRAHEAGSHQKRGWERFTDKAIKHINDNCSGVVFLLWGNYAQLKGSIIQNQSHLILKSAHPSPLGAYRGFFGNHHFSRTNEFLERNNGKPIDWS